MLNLKSPGLIVKKHSKAKPFPHSKIYFQLGLALVLFVIYIALEWKSEGRSIDELNNPVTQTEITEEIPLTKRIIETKNLAPAPTSPEKTEIVKDGIKINKTVLESAETDQSQAVVVNDLKVINEVNEADEVPENEPFGTIIEVAPVFPGCKGSSYEKRKCLQENIEKLVENNYNTGLANAIELGLAPGKIKVYMMFKIDKNGNVTDIQARGPHALLEKEAVRVAEMIPKMTPGKIRDTPTGVKYTLPITLVIQ